MVKFIVYDRQTGTILRRGFCADQDLNLQAKHETEAVADVASDSNIDDDTHCLCPKTLRILPRTDDPKAERRRRQDEARQNRRAALLAAYAEDPAGFLERLIQAGVFDSVVLRDREQAASPDKVRQVSALADEGSPVE